MGWSSRLITVCTVGPRPSLRTLSSTWRTRSGRSRAFPSRLLPAKSMIIFSVPALMSEAALRTAMPPERHTGSGTSVTVSSPERTC
jgi:hypothetical protein